MSHPYILASLAPGGMISGMPPKDAARPPLSLGAESNADLDATRTCIIRIFQFLRVPRQILEKQCLTTCELEDIFSFFLNGPPARVLEIGTFVGFTACLLATSLPRTTIVGVDPGFPVRMQLQEAGPLDERSCLEVARQAVQLAGLAGRVDFIQGFYSCLPTPELRERLCQQRIHWDGLPVVAPRLDFREKFDLVIVDGEHSAEAVRSDLEHAKAVLSPPGLMAVHDIAGHWGLPVREGIRAFLSANSEFIWRECDNLGLVWRSLAPS